MEGLADGDHGPGLWVPPQRGSIAKAISRVRPWQRRTGDIPAEDD